MCMNVLAMDMDVKFNQLRMTSTKNVSSTQKYEVCEKKKSLNLIKNLQYAIWVMVHRLNYYHRLLKKLYLYQLNWIAKMSAYVSEKIHHSNVTHLVLGKKKFQMSAAAIKCMLNSISYFHEIVFFYFQISSIKFQL